MIKYFLFVLSITGISIEALEKFKYEEDLIRFWHNPDIKPDVAFIQNVADEIALWASQLSSQSASSFKKVLKTQLSEARYLNRLNMMYFEIIGFACALDKTTSRSSIRFNNRFKYEKELTDLWLSKGKLNKDLIQRIAVELSEWAPKFQKLDFMQQEFSIAITYLKRIFMMACDVSEYACLLDMVDKK